MGGRGEGAGRLGGGSAVIGPGEERRHRVGPSPSWCETWSFDAAAADRSLGVAVRLVLHPGPGLAWWWADVVGADERLVIVRDREVSVPPGKGLELRAEGLWAELTCEVPLEHWTVGMEAFGLALDRPSDAWHKERGERIPVGLDLEWEGTGPPYEDGSDQEPDQEALRTAGYQQACGVHGQVLLGGDTYNLDAAGFRAHSWGVCHWSRPWRGAWGRLDDGQTFHIPTGRDVGFLLAHDSTPTELSDLGVDVSVDAEHLLAGAMIRLGPLSLRATPLHHAPVLIETTHGTSRLSRALCHYQSEAGLEGTGWAELNAPVGRGARPSHTGSPASPLGWPG